MIGCLGFLYILINIAKCAIYVDASAICPCYGTTTQPFNNIQDGIDFAVQNRFDTVIVRDGYYVATTKLNIPTSDNLQYIISENGSQNTIIDCLTRSSGSGFDINTQMNGQLITLQGFTMINCYYGVYIRSESNVIDMNITDPYYGMYISVLNNPNRNITIMDSFIESSSYRGIYISCSSSSYAKSVLVHNTRILNFRSSYYGIYVYNADRIEIHDSILSNIAPTSTTYYPIYINSNDIDIRNTVVDANGNYIGRTAVNFISSNVYIYNSNILNTIGDFRISSTVNVGIYDSTVSSNAGPGIEIVGIGSAVNVEVNNNEIFNNTGYGVYISGSNSIGYIQGNRIYDNNGNGIRFNGNQITIDNNYIYNNTAPNEGGGINVESGSINIINNSITNNIANHGGGIYWYGISTKTCLIKDNFIGYNNALSEGGGIHLNTSMATNVDISCEISNTMISNNECNFVAGGIYVVRSNVLLTQNTMIYDNNANAYGSDVYCYQSNFTISYDSKIQNNTDNDIYCNIYCNFNYISNGQNVYCRSGFIFV